MPDTRRDSKQSSAERIVVLDGSWGVLLQRGLRARRTYRGERFREHARDVKGDPDLLNLTRPEIVEQRSTTPTSRPAPTSRRRTPSRRRRSARRDYGLGADVVHDMNLEGARLARRVADEYAARRTPRFVAGSVGPLNVTLSLSPKVEDPAFRAVTLRPGASRRTPSRSARCATAASTCC